jgi:hypothetical protein
MTANNARRKHPNAAPGKFLRLAISLSTLLYTIFHPILFVANMLFVIFTAISDVVRIIKNKGQDYQVYLLKIIISFVWCSVLVLDAQLSLIDQIGIQLKSPLFETCRHSGVSIAGGYTLAVCDKDDRWWRYGFTKAIIYDSSDQIGIPASKRTKEWVSIAVSMGEQVPFGILGFSARRLTGHYYSVSFFDDRQPDLIDGV